MSEILVKRIYDVPGTGDGFRILVDRLWSRGIKKETACIDLWAKEIAPSADLRRWFGHEYEKYEPFATLYKQELDSNAAATDFAGLCKQHLHTENITLLYAAKDAKHNNARVLKDWLTEKLS